MSYASLSNLLSDGWPEDTVILELDDDGNGVLLETLSWFRTQQDEEFDPETETIGFWRRKYERAVSSAVIGAQRAKRTRESQAHELDEIVAANAKLHAKLAATENEVTFLQGELTKAQHDLVQADNRIAVLVADTEKLERAAADQRAAVMEELFDRFVGPR